MSKNIIWQKRNNKYAVYEVEKEYDPTTKNMKQVNKDYLGMADEKGDPPKRKQKNEVQEIYEYGFLAYLDSLRKKYSIEDSYLKRFDTEMTNAVLLYAYYLVSCPLNINYLPEWMRHQWYSLAQEYKIEDTDGLKKFILALGDRLSEQKDKKEMYDIKMKNSFVYIHKRTLREEMIREDVFSFGDLSGGTKYKTKDVDQYLYSTVKKHDFKIITSRPNTIKVNELSKNINLIKVMDLSRKTEKEVEKEINDNRRQSFILILKENYVFEDILSKRKFKKNNIAGFKVFYESTISDKSIESIIAQIQWFLNEEAKFYKRICEIADKVETERLYTLLSGFYFIFTVLFQLKFTIMKERKLSSCDEIVEEIEKLQVYFQPVKYLIYNDDSSMVFDVSNRLNKRMR